MNVSIIVGGVGFVGINLIERLLTEERKIVIIDNLLRGKKHYLQKFDSKFCSRIEFMKVDASNIQRIKSSFEIAKQFGKVDEVWHLAANSDIATGNSDGKVDLKHTFLTTFSILEAMKESQINALHFASSSAIYGDHGDTILSENTSPLMPISNYGAMKLASEAIISASTETFLKRSNIFRFPNVVGVPATHGVILDFIRKLKINKEFLEVLGDGSQKKSYLHVSDLVDAMICIRAHETKEKVFILNIGPIDEGITVRHIAETVRDLICKEATLKFGQTNKGWLGDVPRFRYSVEKLISLGWKPKYSSAQAIIRAISQIYSQEASMK